MPLLPLTLSALLESPNFRPGSTPNNADPVSGLPHPITLPPTEQNLWFEILSKSLSFQITLAIHYLHGLAVPIAHRDVKPGNVLIDETGCVKLIDFGIAWRNTGDTSSPVELVTSPYDIPEESAQSMICQVGSGCVYSPISPDSH